MCDIVNLFWPCHARHNIPSQIVQKTQVRLLSKTQRLRSRSLSRVAHGASKQPMKMMIFTTRNKKATYLDYDSEVMEN
jgi:hypothetical protein